MPSFTSRNILQVPVLPNPGFHPYIIYTGIYIYIFIHIYRKGRKGRDGREGKEGKKEAMKEGTQGKGRKGKRKK